MKKEIIYLDSCQPDYFQGFSGRTFISFHHRGQSIREALDDLMINAQNEDLDAETFEALERYKNRWINSSDAEKNIICEQYCEFDENDYSGLIHYFGVKNEDL